jgi:hypothetical protein
VEQCNFSLDHYFKTLYKFIDNGYVILPDAKVNRHIHLRHDVDLSLSYAVELAKEEQKRDIFSTYYIMLHSSLYNVHSPEGIEQIREIHNLGHNIGLHIDTRCHLPNDFQTLSLIVGERVGDWRKHLSNLTPEFIVPEPRPKDYKYISESGMNWREGCFCQQIGKYDKMEILIHPEWWTVSPAAKRNRFEIIEDLKQEAKGTVSNSFAGFRDMVQEYMQVVSQ